MAEVLFPVYPEGTTMINSFIGFRNFKDIGIVYFNEGGPFFKHQPDDYKSFRFITSQMMDLKQVRQIEVINTFKISKESAKRWLKIYRKKGVSEFFKPSPTRGKGKIITQEVIDKVELKLKRGESVKEIGEALNIKPDTIKKAIQAGRIKRPVSETLPVVGSCDFEGKTQSQRNSLDKSSPLGMGCTNTIGRVEALKKT